MQSYDQELATLTAGNRDKVTPDGDEDTPSDTLGLRVENESTCPDVTAERGYWGSKLEFFLAIVGYTVGVGSFWRFPIICSRNGGGAFLIPFYFLLITSGGPLYYLEVCLGQFSGKSAGLAFGFCPLLKVYDVSLVNGSENNLTANSLSANKTMNATDTYQSAAFEFWEYKVIGRSSGLDDMGHLQSHLVICLIIAWTLNVLAVINGAKSLGKVVYVTATTPFLCLVVMFIRGVTLDGALDGITFFLKPDFSKLFTTQMWLEAGIQVFFSLGPTWGGVITMASYNKFHQKTFWWTTLCVMISGFSSFFNGLVVFTILGFMAKETGLSVQEVATQSGPGLTFVVFPIALSKMPFPQLWSVLFFLMLTTVVFDSIFGMVETISSGIIDSFPKQLNSKRILVNVTLGVFMAVISLPLCLNNGVYIFQLADWYFSQFALLFGSLFECIAVFWIYGTDRFSRDIALMTGRPVSPLLRCMWSVVIPTSVTITFMLMLSRYSAPSYGDGYVYSSGAIAIGIAVGLLPNIGMVCVAIRALLRANGTFIERFRISTIPDKTWQPNDKEARQIYRMKPYDFPGSFKDRLTLNLLGPKSKYDF